MSTSPNQVQPKYFYICPLARPQWTPAQAIEVSTPSLPTSRPDLPEHPTPQTRPYPSWASISTYNSCTVQHLQPPAPLSNAQVHQRCLSLQFSISAQPSVPDSRLGLKPLKDKV